MQRSSYRSTVLSNENFSRDMHRAVEASPKPKYSNLDRRFNSEHQPPPPPPSPVAWNRNKSDRV
ncbi:hypothetical protein PV10_04417 [Exophiala mesophila]|uniref:Uncharacterized protein n=1 Tax=Exophiala mesophila TaxID=212818 RepID=A0A0D1WV38_EXOME|nr:uncharacterized protein PV10_04417 [Exophiala mesophila]KIV93180.1 hypothetical protein PV10_04417 [Exophiala mesophila]